MSNFRTENGEYRAVREPGKAFEKFVGLMGLKRDEIRLICSGNRGALPLPLWERVG
jgi:hypothetical protein